MLSRHQVNERARRNLFAVVQPLEYVCYVDLIRAMGYWIVCEGFLFNLDYRICGTPDNIHLEMSRNGFSNEFITEISNNSITKDNYQTTKKDEYNREVERYGRHIEVGLP
jgi:hypothetical protein